MEWRLLVLISNHRRIHIPHPWLGSSLSSTVGPLEPIVYGLEDGLTVVTQHRLLLWLGLHHAAGRVLQVLEKLLLKRMLATLPNYDWEGLVTHVAFVLNTSVSPRTNHRPIEMVFGKDIGPSYLDSGIPAKPHYLVKNDTEEFSPQAARILRSGRKINISVNTLPTKYSGATKAQWKTLPVPHQPTMTPKMCGMQMATSKVETQPRFRPVSWSLSMA